MTFEDPTMIPKRAEKVPFVKFNNNEKCPMLGLGTWKSKPGEVIKAVSHAIKSGYRHIDCAHVYGNEKEVGEGIKRNIDEGVVTREELFITSKLWNNSHRSDLVEPALRLTLKNLGLEYLNLYLIHWPFAFKEGDDLFPQDGSGNLEFSDVDYVDTWKAMEEVCKKGLTKSIGVSNFNKNQLEKILEVATITPVVNQIECHPYLTQLKISKFCKSKGITIVAYSPLGSPDRPWAKPEDPLLLEDPRIKELAKKHKKTSAQVVLRYQIQRDHITIPKSVTASRIEENFDIWDFELDSKDIELINQFDCNGRICSYVEAISHKHHPFVNDDALLCNDECNDALL